MSKYKVQYRLGKMQKEFYAENYEDAKTIKKDCGEYGYKTKIIKL